MYFGKFVLAKDFESIHQNAPNITFGDLHFKIFSGKVPPTPVHQLNKPYHGKLKKKNVYNVKTETCALCA